MQHAGLDRRWLALGFALLVSAGCGGSGSAGSTQPPAAPPPPVETFSSGIFSASSSPNVFVHTFPTAGTFSYHCLVHGNAMTGTVQVTAGTADSSFVTIGDNFFSPALVQVHTGGYVKWVNTGGNHGVQND